MTNYSPLRYPGGKGKLTPYVKALLQMNGLEGGHYVEPFAGGAAVALDLLFSELVKHIHINDLDWTVFAFWKSALDYTDDLIELIVKTPITIESWLAARDIRRNASQHDIVAVGFSTFLLNRTNRSGILNGGVIGGIAQDGPWKIGCRFNKQDLIARIRRIGIYKNRISLSNIDAKNMILDYLPTISQNSLIYLDPPYYDKGAFLYQNHFKHADHVSLSQAIAQITRHRWVVSYDNSESIRLIYDQFEQEQFSIGYSARNYNKGAEVMIFGPDVQRPSKVFANKMEYAAFKKMA